MAAWSCGSGSACIFGTGFALASVTESISCAAAARAARAPAVPPSICLRFIYVPSPGQVSELAATKGEARAVQIGAPERGVARTLVVGSIAAVVPGSRVRASNGARGPCLPLLKPLRAQRLVRTFPHRPSFLTAEAAEVGAHGIEVRVGVVGPVRRGR